MELCQTLLLIFAVLFQLAPQFSSTSTFHRIPRVRYNAHWRSSAKYKYDVKTFEVPVDHFSFAVQDTFKIRYLVNNTWQGKQDPPIFFYTGNEGDIELFAENTGFMWDSAPLFEALIVFAEHRYYGDSLPFGNESFSGTKHLGYLTSQQAIADYVDLIQYFRSQSMYKDSPVILFGGSYGGMLSAWMRMKYPHIVQGAIAASAPILQFSSASTCEAFNRIVTSDFRAAHDSCPKFIRKSWSIIKNVTADADGRKWLSDNWKLCQPLKNSTDVDQLKDFLEEVYVDLAMANYPYSANFLAPLPANPINVVCTHLTNTSLTGKDLLTALYEGINVYNNYTGQSKCLDIQSPETSSLGSKAWDFQYCTEMVLPVCSDGVNDMFEAKPWSFPNFYEHCTKTYSIKAQPNLACKEYGCTDLSAATNIIFSNGLMDPWSSGGVLRNLSSSAIAIIIPEGAHHLDLRGSNINDPYSVILARKYHRYYIKKWIKEFRQREERILVL